MTCKPYAYQRTDVIDGLIYTAACPCGWESDDATNITVARIRADRHQQEGENE